MSVTYKIELAIDVIGFAVIIFLYWRLVYNYNKGNKNIECSASLNGQNYYYKITAVNEKSDEEKQKKQIELEIIETGNKLTIDEVPGATGYLVNGNRTKITPLFNK